MERPVQTAARTVVAVIAWAASAGFPNVDAQRRGAGQDRGTVSVAIDLKVGSESLVAKGPGRCTHAPQASIYSTPSKMWTARSENASGKAVQLTVWRPLDGSTDMFSLSAGTLSVSTVGRGQPTGSGTVTFEPGAAGGTFRVAARSADGRAITGLISCDAFTPHVAEGG
jgi:hypothetical protein